MSNFCCGTAIPAKSNKDIADHINPKISKFMEQFPEDKNLGVVIFDYPTSIIVDSVIQQNELLESGRLPFYMPLLRLLKFT